MENEPEGPPLFKSWNAMYAWVLATLVVLVVLFSFLTKFYAGD